MMKPNTLILALLGTCWMVSMQSVQAKKDKSSHGKSHQSQKVERHKVQKAHKKANKFQGFDDSSVHVFQNYFGRYQSTRGMPPGIAKQVAAGKGLPPGWAKNFAPGTTLTDQVWLQRQPLPQDLLRQLNPRRGESYYILDNRLVRVNDSTRMVLSILTIADLLSN